MLTVTETAEEKLEEHLQTKTDDPEIAIRLVASHSGSARLSLVLDKEQKIQYSEILDNPGNEPNYNAIKEVLEKLK